MSSSQLGYLTTSKSLAIFPGILLVSIEKLKKFQIFYLSNHGETSWNEIAKYIGEVGLGIESFSKKWQKLKN